MQSDIRRAWINQPSTLQMYHKWHGTNVLADYTHWPGITIYFLSGDVVSMVVDSPALSPGWR